MAQNVSVDTLPSSAGAPSATNHVSVQNKMHVNIMAGTEYWSAPGYGSGIASYLMTGMNFPLGKRFSIGGGIGILNTTPVGIRVNLIFLSSCLTETYSC